MSKNIKILIGIVLVIVIVIASITVGGFITYRTITKSATKTKVTEISKNDSYVFTKQNYPKIDSATAMYPLATEITKAVLNISNDEAKKLVLCSKTPEAYKNLINGKVDIIFLFGPSNEEVTSAQEKGFELEKTSIGKDAFVFINNKDNPIKTLKRGQLRDIYQGKITNWKEVGGTDNEIIAYQRPKNSGSQTLMEEFMKGAILITPPTERVEQEMAGLVDVIADYKASQKSLGYSVFYYANEMYANPNINFLKVDGILPSRESIKSGKYPLTKDVYAVIKSTEPKDSPVRKLIDFVLTDKGQVAVEKGGYVRIK